MSDSLFDQLLRDPQAPSRDHGPPEGAPRFTLIEDAGGRFSIDAQSGVVTLADPALLQCEFGVEHAVRLRYEANAESYELPLRLKITGIVPSTAEDLFSAAYEEASDTEIVPPKANDDEVKSVSAVEYTSPNHPFSLFLHGRDGARIPADADWAEDERFGDLAYAQSVPLIEGLPDFDAEEHWRLEHAPPRPATRAAHWLI